MIHGSTVNCDKFVVDLYLKARRRQSGWNTRIVSLHAVTTQCGSNVKQLGFFILNNLLRGVRTQSAVC